MGIAEGLKSMLNEGDHKETYGVCLVRSQGVPVGDSWRIFGSLSWYRQIPTRTGVLAIFLVSCRSTPSLS